MKPTTPIILLLCVLPIASFAQRGVLLGLPHDDPNARRDAYLNRVELRPVISEYDQLIKTRIGALNDKDISKVFGPRLEQRNTLVRNGDPTNSVAPLFAPYTLSFSGLIDLGDKSHRDLYAVESLGYVEFFYELDGTLKTAVLYVRLDDKFVPLKSANDFFRRLEWDKAKFDALKKCLDAHLVPIEDGKPLFRNPPKDSTK